MKQENSVIMTGRLGKDPDHRVAQSGSSVVKFSIAQSHAKKNAEGGWDKLPTSWFNWVCFKNVAEIAMGLKKGDMVRLTGRAEPENYEKDGVKHYGMKFIAHQIEKIETEKKPQTSQEEELPF